MLGVNHDPSDPVERNYLNVHIMIQSILGESRKRLSMTIGRRRMLVGETLINHAGGG